MIGEKMKELRQELGYSAEQVAEYLKISPATVYRYERGDIRKMPAIILEPLAQLLKSSPGELMGWTDTTSQSDNLSEDEQTLLTGYRSLSTSGKEYVIQQVTIARLAYGEKDSDIQSKDSGTII